MPIEIREVIIRANLERRSAQKNPKEAIDRAQLKDLKQEIIEACMEKLEARLERHFKL